MKTTGVSRESVNWIRSWPKRRLRTAIQ